MNIVKNDVAVILSAEGRDVMRLGAVNLPEAGAVTVYVRDTDDLGLWVKIERTDGDHLLLIRWEYVLSIDILPADRKSVGIRTS